MGLFDTLGRNIATVGQILGLPEWGISEKFAGSQQQTQPYIYGSAGGAYVQPTYAAEPPQRQWTPAVEVGGYGGVGYPSAPTPAPTSAPTPAPTGGGDVDRMAAWRNLGNTGDLPEGWFGPYTREGVDTQRTQQASAQADIDRREAETRGAIESGYSDYFAQLDEMLNKGLPAQQASQEQLAKLQYTGGVEQLQPQYAEGQTQLQRQRETTETTQAKNLRDIAANVRNAFMAGNVFLGAQGAGDSSAVNQYSYALGKLGTQQRTDIMKQTAGIIQQIGDKETNLKNVYDSEVKNLANQRDQQVMSIATWFAEQQNALRQAQAQGALQKGQDLATLSQNLLSNALNRLNQIETEATNRRSALEQWALNNSKTIQEAKANLQAISGFNPAQPQVQPTAWQPTMAGGNIRAATGVQTGYGGQTAEEEKKPLFSNPTEYLA